MRHVALAAATVLLVLAGAWAWPAPAYACSCGYESEDPELIRNAEVIFTGVVSGDRALGDTRKRTGPFLVMGKLNNGVLWADLCGGTRPGAAPAELGTGYPPQPGSSENPVRWLVLSGVVVVLAAIVIVPRVVRRRRSARPEG